MNVTTAKIIGAAGILIIGGATMFINRYLIILMPFWVMTIIISYIRFYTKSKGERK